MRIVAALIASAALVLSSCGGDKTSEDAVVLGALVAATKIECRSWADAPVTADTIDKGCGEDGSLKLSATKLCADGRTIFWNDVGWGYFGERMRLHDDTPGPKVPPTTEYSRCVGLP